MIEETLTCHLCCSQNMSQVPFGYKFNGRWLGGTKCKDCGIIFVHPQPTDDELKSLYKKEYFQGDFRCGHAGSYFNEETLQRLADPKLLDRIQTLKPKGKFLEIGCAGGAFLRSARDCGYETWGVEFSSDAAEFARKRFDLNVFVGSLPEAQFEEDFFDVIFMGDVVEHLPNPVFTMKEIRRITAPEAILVILCPTQTNTLFSRIGFAVYGALNKRAIVNLPPYHLFEYRPRSLKRLLTSHGFQVIRIVQTAMVPGEVALRGITMENLGKKFLQFPNYYLTKFFNVLGDRAEIYAIREKGAFAR